MGDATEAARLRDEYIERVNMAVAEGRDDLIAELEREYLDAGLALLLRS